MATADQAVAIFDSFVGITESPPHSNRTPIGREFGWDGVAWCAETCSVVLYRVFGRKIIWTASVAQVIADAKAGRNGLVWVSPNDTIRKGDLVCYDFGGRGSWSDFHIAMVRNPGTQARFQTDGGNESDAVRQQWRDRTYVQGFARPPYDAPAPLPPSEEDDMTRDEAKYVLTALGQVVRMVENIQAVQGEGPGAIKQELDDVKADVAAIKTKLGA